MATVFPLSGGVTTKAFDGLVLLSLDGGSTVWAFPGLSVQVSDSDNISRPDVIDASEISHVEIPGVRLGSLSFSFPLMPDRNVNSFLLAAFGQRLNQSVTPFIINIIPSGGDAVLAATGLWFSRITFSGAFGTSGQQAVNLVRVSAVVIDPDNLYGGGALAAPAGVGANGLGASSFVQSSFGNGGGTTYDKIRSYSLTFDNQLSIVPGMSNAAARLAAGCQVGTLRGALTLEQLAHPASPLPGVKGLYPFALRLPTGDGTKALTINANTSRDGSSLSLVPTDFIGRGQLYSVYGTSTLVPNWLFSTSYA